ncbi:MAG TPA: hypothetical protein VHC18_02505 [Amycolatopsis sp.]|nr:hypothetical protein [Amycolatopsis sp.]
MRRACAVAAAIAAVVTLTAAGTGSATGLDSQAQTVHPLLEVHLHEIGTRGAEDSRAEFVEIANRGSRALPLGGDRVLVGLHSYTVELARIPDYVVLQPNAVYLLASAWFVGCPVPPDQLFAMAEDIPEVFTMTLVAHQGEIMDVVTTAPNLLPGASPAPRPHDGLCLGRLRFTGNNAKDWAVKRCTPGVY